MVLPQEIPLARTCPVCGEAMESGHVLGSAGTTGRANAILATISWLPKTPKPPSMWSEHLETAEPLAPVPSGLKIYYRPRFPAWRCVKCSRVEFTYNDTVLDPLEAAKENPPVE